MSDRTAVIFDMDGTLTDTEELWDQVRRALAAEDGCAWPPTATTDQMGMSTQEWSRYLVEKVGMKGTPEQVADRVVDRMVEAYQHGATILLPGAVEAVQRMAARGPIGLATSSPRRLIDAALEVMGTTHLFAATISTEEVGGKGKPAPDAFLHVCQVMGVEPHRTVAVEDSTNGIKAAHNARMKVVAIPPHFHPPKAEALALADVILDSLDELTVELVNDLLARPARLS